MIKLQQALDPYISEAVKTVDFTTGLAFAFNKINADSAKCISLCENIANKLFTPGSDTYNLFISHGFTDNNSVAVFISYEMRRNMQQQLMRYMGIAG